MENQQQQLDKLWEITNQQSGKIDRILSYLESDGSTGRMGLYEEIRDIDDRLKRVEKTMQANLTRKSILVTIGAVIMWVIVSLMDIYEFFKTFFAK